MFIGGGVVVPIVLIGASIAVMPVLKCRVHGRVRLRRLWATSRVVCVVCGLVLTLDSLPNIKDARKKSNSAALGIPFILLFAFATPRARGRVRSCLTKLVKRGSEQQQSAALAATFRGTSPSTILERAARAFRVLPLHIITSENLAAGTSRMFGQKPKKSHGDISTQLREGVTSRDLGTCDAFCSHSHADDPAEKFAALQRWGTAMAETGATEPTLWLDLACIDHEDVAGSLELLPVFISGCKALLIVAGETFPSRLWCLSEVRACSLHRPSACIHVHAHGVSISPVCVVGMWTGGRKSVCWLAPTHRYSSSCPWADSASASSSKRSVTLQRLRRPSAGATWPRLSALYRETARCCSP